MRCIVSCWTVTGKSRESIPPGFKVCAPKTTPAFQTEPRLRIVHVSCILKSSMMLIRMIPTRTTLTIEPDVELLLEREMRRTDKSMKAAVNDALRIGLGMRGNPPRPPRFKVQPLAFAFKPSIDTDRLNHQIPDSDRAALYHRNPGSRCPDLCVPAPPHREPLGRACFDPPLQRKAHSLAPSKV